MDPVKGSAPLNRRPLIVVNRSPAEGPWRPLRWGKKKTIFEKLCVDEGNDDGDEKDDDVDNDDHVEDAGNNTEHNNCNHN